MIGRVPTAFTRRRVAEAAVFCCLLVFPALAAAVSGNFFVLPPSPDGTPVYSLRNGLKVEIDDRWFDGAGYRPIRLRFSTETAAAADRRIAIRMAFSDSGRAGDDDLIVSQSVAMPAGAGTVETVVRCPAVSAWSSMSWEVKVDGQVDKALSSPQFVPSQGVMAGSMSGPGGMLRIVRPSRIDESELQDERLVSPLTVGINRRQIGERLMCEPMTNWLDYSGAEVISVDLPTLRLLSERSQDEVVALRRWLVAGGILWVEQVEQKGVATDSYAEIETLLEIARWRMTVTDELFDIEQESSLQADGEGTDGNADSPPPDSVAAERRQLKGAVTPVDNAPGWGYVKLDTDRSQNDGGSPFQSAVLESLTGPEDSDTRGWFAQRDAGFGRVLAFDKLPFDVPSQLQFGRRRQLFSVLENHRWVDRYGLEPGTGSAEFGNLLIPGVGLAPVNAFQVLITLFVIVIGPLNYWLLWRRRQLHLLVLTTPLVALAATLGLAAYASVADGFGVKARAHSVTLLDQASGEAATWARVSHYVATTPEELPSVPDDTAIYPIEPVWEAAFADPDADLAVAWEGNRQVLKSGWTPSRSAVQHLLVRSHRTDKRLDLTGQGASIRVANRFGTPLDLLVVRNDAGEWLMTEQLGKEDAVVLKPVERLDAMQAFRKLAISRLPSFPLGAGRAVEDTLSRVGSAARDIRRMQRGIADAALSENAQARVLDALTGLDGGRSLDVPPRTYVAVASQTIDTPLCWESVEELDSFHVVVGRW